MAAKVYPDWVQRYRTKGTTVKKVGNNYYLYKHSSKRVKGKKNPVPRDTYIGRITQEGVIKGKKKKISTDDTDIIVKEFGFSRAIEVLCPMDWKNPLGTEWQRVLDKIIIDESPESYISDERLIEEVLEPHIQFGAQKGSFMRRLENTYGIKLKELYPLKTVYRVVISGTAVVSKISDEQKQLLERLHIDLEVR